MTAASAVAACSTPDRLDEPWPPDPATCLQHLHPDAPRNSGVRLATQGTYTRQTAHTAVLYFCFQNTNASKQRVAHLVTHPTGCVTQVSPSVADVPTEPLHWQAVPFTMSICERGHGSVGVLLNYTDNNPGTVLDSAYVNVTADDHGVLIEESRR